MKAPLAASLFTTSFALLIPAAGASPPPTQTEHRIISLLAPGVSGEAVATAFGLTVDGSIPELGLWCYRVPETLNASLEQIVTDMDAHSATVYAERDHRLAVPEFEACGTGGQVSVQQCTIGFVSGTTSPDGYLNQSWMTDLGVDDAQAYHAGLTAPSTPLVAVVDTGVDPGHPALANVIDGPGVDFVGSETGGWDVANGVDDDGDGLIDEAYGHGTHVAGTIALVYPDVRLRSYRVLEADGSGWGFNVVRGIWRAIADGADVINLSIGMSNSTLTVEALLDLAVALGIDVYAAGGNTATNLVIFPANEAGAPGSALVAATPSRPRGVIAVSAVDAGDLFASFASTGPELDLAAPGVGIHSAIPGGEYAAWDGTSMATAVACGIGALVRACDGLPASETLADTAVPTTQLPAVGRVDAAAALGLTP